MDVLQQRVAQQVIVAGLPDDRGYRRQPRLLRGAPAPLPHHQLVAAPGLVPGGIRRDLPHHDGLHESELADGVHQLGQRLLVEHLAGLARIRFDPGGVDLPIDGTDAARPAVGGLAADHDIGRGFAHPRAAVGGPGGNQRCQPAAQAAPAS